jgi:hypothetical protein
VEEGLDEWRIKGQCIVEEVGRLLRCGWVPIRKKNDVMNVSIIRKAIGRSICISTDIKIGESGAV